MQGARAFNTNEYKYGFNGKENDNETVGTGEGTQDYGMRIYNPALGKFLSVDPLSESYPWNSTYAFAENDVIRCIDLDGLEKTLPASQTGLHNGYTTAIETTGRSAINDATLKQLSQAMNYKKNLLLQAPQKYQGELKQGGVQGTDEYIATTTNMDNVASATVPFYNPTKTLIKGGEVSKTEIGIEIASILPIFKIAGKVGGPILRLINKEGMLILKGSGTYGMCSEFAADFMKRVAPLLEKEGATVAQYEINIGKNGYIGTATQGLADNGMHQFTEVIKDGKSFIFDNMHTNGVPKEEYFKQIAGDNGSGAIIEGTELLEKYTTKLEPK